MNQNFNGKPRKYAFLTSYPSDSYTYGTWNPLYWKNRYCNYRLKKKKIPGASSSVLGTWKSHTNCLLNSGMNKSKKEIQS